MGLGQRLGAAWAALCAGDKPSAEETELLTLRRDLATARLDLQDAHEEVERLRTHTGTLEEDHAAAVEQSLEKRLEGLFTSLAAPLSQLRTQAYLLEEKKPVPVADVMLLVDQLALAVEEAGLTPLGAPGDALPFDPGTMQEVRGEPAAPGAEVDVMFVGYRFGYRVLRKAMVEARG